MVCYLSQVGHNNFYYPSDKKAVLDEDCDYIFIPWISAKGFRAIKIKSDCLLPLELDKQSADETLLNDKEYAIVWIELE